VPLSGTGTAAAVKKSAVSIKSSANPAGICSPVILTAKVATQGGTSPTGAIDFMDGAKLLGAAEIKNGEAKFSILPRTAETVMVLAKYPGDEANEAATSPVFKQVFTTGANERAFCRGR
jgi:hypothetical protein